MPILNTIQKRSWPGKVLLAFFYALLGFGAIWMVYPFLLMLGGSLKSEVDARQPGLIPRFLYDEDMLFRKYEEQRYGRIDIASAVTHARGPGGARLYSFQAFPTPAEPGVKKMEDWENFLKETRKTGPAAYFAMGHVYGPRTIPEITFEYLQRLRAAFPKVSSKELRVIVTPEEWNSRNYRPPLGPYGEVYATMRAQMAPRYFYPISLDGVFALNVVAPHFGTSADAVARMNTEWGTHYESMLDVVLKPTRPEVASERALWEQYVRESLSPRFVTLSPELLPGYRRYLQSKYQQVEQLNKAYESHYAKWEEVGFPQSGAPLSAYSDEEAYIKTMPDLSGVAIHSPEIEWKRYLRGKYRGDIASLNAAWGSRESEFETIPTPVLEYDRKLLKENKRAILWDLVTRNYRIAWDQVVVGGHGLRNTVVFCLLNILTALIINPLAAYALSRFQPSWGPFALFLLMATMAFPAEVTQIPVFLLLRDFGWLNTFAALVIPAAANGYSIFLLKGFFDSLPKDLYEAATIDGCGELRAFFSITLPLSAPILAVIALGAFAAAYGAFMFALLVCQKESMWTLMVYIYQLQQNYSSPVVFAALVIAAIPTLTVFVLCQNIIMKGIVVPVEK
ncbi:hypothetical protein BH09VER1_BH09VER1_25540 [soil metagenome]